MRIHNLIKLTAIIAMLAMLGTAARGQTLLYQWNFDNANPTSGAGLAVPPAVVDTADGYTGGAMSAFVNGGNGTLATPPGSGWSGNTNAADLALVNSGLYNTASEALAGGVGDLSQITNFTVSLWFNLNGGVTNFFTFNGSQYNGRLFCLDTNTSNPQVGTAADGNELYFALATPAAANGPLRIQFGVFKNSNQVAATPFGGVGGASPATFTNQWIFIAASYTTNANGTALIYVGTTNSGASLAATMTGVGWFTNSTKTWLSTSNLVEIGNRIAGSGNRPLMGAMDDVRFYGSALTAAQIQQIQGVVSPPTITLQPASIAVFSGVKAQLSVTANGTLPLSYQWMRNGTNLIDSTNIFGALSNTLSVASISAADVATNYTVIITNVAGAVTSSVVSVLIVPTNGAYEGAVLADGPFAFYTFSETGDPSTNTLANDSMGSFNGTYGTAAQNGFKGIVGPNPAQGLSGFPATNAALQTLYSNVPPTSYVTAPAFNLNSGIGTNVLTITAWIYPVGAQTHGAAIVFCRAGSTVAGLFYNATNTADNNLKLGYNWNNENGTYSWDSGLEPATNQWSLVALTVTSTNATIYLINTNSLQSSTHTYAHVPLKFDGVTLIGNDSVLANGTRTYNGSIDEVAFFNQALTSSQMASLFTAASGIVFAPPNISGEPAWLPSTATVSNMTHATVTANGTPPLSYQWMASAVGSGIYTNLIDDGNLAGSTTATLTITNAQTNYTLDYIVVITNLYGSVTSTPPATLTVTTNIGTVIIPITFQLIGKNLQLNWSQGILQQATNLPGAWTPVIGATPPSYTNVISPTTPRMFFRVHP